MDQSDMDQRANSFEALEEPIVLILSQIGYNIEERPMEYKTSITWIEEASEAQDDGSNWVAHAPLPCHHQQVYFHQRWRVYVSGGG